MTLHVHAFYRVNILYILSRSRTSILLKDCVKISSFFCLWVIMIQDFKKLDSVMR